jgi:hypothetical protein
MKGCDRANFANFVLGQGSRAPPIIVPSALASCLFARDRNPIGPPMAAPRSWGGLALGLALCALSSLAPHRPVRAHRYEHPKR